MKKVLKLVLVMALALALAATAFAADSPAERTTVMVQSPDGTTVLAQVPTVIGQVSTSADATTRVVFEAADANTANSNAALGEQAVKRNGGSVVANLGSWDMTVTKGSQKVHSGFRTTLTFNFDQAYVGKHAVLMEDGRVNQSFPITAKAMSCVVTSASTFTLLVSDAPVQGATSPATSQSNLTVTLMGAAFLALAGAAIAAKRRTSLQ